LDLMQALLHSPSSSGDAILQKHAGLLDVGLVQMMERAAVVMAEKGVRYLGEAQYWRDTAAALAHSLHYTSRATPAETDAVLHFVLEVLTKIKESQGNVQSVVRFLAAHLHYLTRECAHLVHVWACLTLSTFPSPTDPVVQADARWLSIFGSLMLNFAQGNQADNLEIALASLVSTLYAYSREETPLTWALVQVDIGNAYNKRQCGSPTKNIEDALSCYQRALDIYTQSSHPYQWALSHYNMAIAYLKRPTGSRRTNIEQAITCCEQALRVWTAEAFPRPAASASACLADARTRLKQVEEASAGGRGLTPEEATTPSVIQPVATLSRTEQAPVLAVLRPVEQSGLNPQKVYPAWQTQLAHFDAFFATRLRTWAAAAFATVSPQQARRIAVVLYHACRCLLDFPYGEHAVHVESAIVAAQAALQMSPRETFPKSWREISMYLGVAYEERQHGDQTEKWEQALACYEQAAQVLQRDDSDPLSALLWGQLHGNFGNAYRNRVRGEKTANIAQAILHYERALEVLTQQAFPEAWSATMHNLAVAYIARPDGDRAANLDRAIAYCQAAATVQQQHGFQALWSLSQGTLAVAQQQRQHWARLVAMLPEHPQVQRLLIALIQAMHGGLGSLPQEIALWQSRQIPTDMEELVVPQLETFLTTHQSDLTPEVLEGLYRWSASVAAGERDLSLPVCLFLMVFAEGLVHWRHGDRAIQVVIATAAYSVVAQPVVQRQWPALWGAVQERLGALYLHLYDTRYGEPGEQLERALGCFQQALQVLTPHEVLPLTSEFVLSNTVDLEDMPLLQLFQSQVPRIWRRVQGNVGYVYHHRRQGDKAENEEAALHAYRTVLADWPQDEDSEGWAKAQNGLGEAYMMRLRGVEAENLEQALTAFHTALTVLTREELPALWAQVQWNLGRAYTARMDGQAGENLQKAIHHCDLALTVWTRDTSPEDWALAQAARGVAYYQRGCLHRTTTGAVDFEEARRNLEAALLGTDRRRWPERWASLNHNLGLLYSDRRQGDRAENLEQALTYLQDALQEYTREKMPYAWAHTHRNLAAIYWERVLGSHAENIEVAIDSGKKALQVLTHDNAPMAWARAQTNLGGAYKNRSYGTRADNLEHAIACYQQALQVVTLTTDRWGWAAIHFNLGTCYKDLGAFCHHHPEEYLEEAITCYTKALEVMDRTHFPYDWADIQNSLGNAYRHRLRGTRTTNYAEAFICFAQALEVRTRDGFPREHVLTLRNRGDAFLELQQWHDAYVTFRDAIATIEVFRVDAIAGEEAKRKWAEESQAHYQGMVTACLHLGATEPQYFTTAWEYVERSKARSLVELLASRVPPQGPIPAHLWNDLQRLRIAVANEQRRLEDVERALILGRTPSSAPTVEVALPDEGLPLAARTHLHRLQREYDARLTEANTFAPRFSITQRVEPLPWSAMQALLPDEQTALIAWYVLDTAQTFCAFVLTRHAAQPLVW
jgi:tetratricopeptide (TPR) repeat protein